MGYAPSGEPAKSWSVLRRRAVTAGSTSLPRSAVEIPAKVLHYPCLRVCPIRPTEAVQDGDGARRVHLEHRSISQRTAINGGPVKVASRSPNQASYSRRPI